MLVDNIEEHKVYNVACGEQTSLNEMIDILGEIANQHIKANYGPERAGDVKHSRAAINKIESELGYKPSIYFKEGLAKVYKWYAAQMEIKS